jgi:hypothetical protein
MTHVVSGPVEIWACLLDTEGHAFNQYTICVDSYL